jgi:hypothetical protein
MPLAQYKITSEEGNLLRIQPVTPEMVWLNITKPPNYKVASTL